MDRENLLKDQCRKESGKWIASVTPQFLVKRKIKRRRDELRDIKMLFQKLEKGRGIIHEHILAV